jgi:transcriptional regulator with XRE-family HTH domain
MLDHMNKLSEIMSDFRARFNLSKAGAARALGCSINWVRSAEEGKDVNTGLSFTPREATLRQIATRMTEYAQGKGLPFPVTYEQLMVAAGYLTEDELAFHEGRTEPPTAEQIRQGDMGIPGGMDLAASADGHWDELTDSEQLMVQRAVDTLARQLIGDILAGRKQRRLKGPNS